MCLIHNRMNMEITSDTYAYSLVNIQGRSYIDANTQVRTHIPACDHFPWSKLSREQIHVGLWVACLHMEIPFSLGILGPLFLIYLHPPPSTSQAHTHPPTWGHLYRLAAIITQQMSINHCGLGRSREGRGMETHMRAPWGGVAGQSLNCLVGKLKCEV